MDVHGAPEIVEQPLAVAVGEDHGAGLQARQVEGLGAGDAGDNVACDLRGEGSHRGVLLAVEDEVGVDLVGEHLHVVFHAKLRHTAKLLRCPHDAKGVVGVAEEEEVAPGELFLKFLPVHDPPAVLLPEGALHHLPPGGLGHVVKFGVNGGLDQNAAALGSEQANHHGNGLDHAKTVAHFFHINLPVVPALLPVPDGLKIALRPGGIAPETLLGPLRQGVDDGLGGAEIHIRDPQGDHVGGAEFFDALVILGRAVFAAVDDGVKIVFHGGPPGV